MYTLASLAATCIPLALAAFVMDRYVENLPDCWSLSAGLLYSLVWLSLGYVQGDYHALGQNAVGAIRSIIFLILLTWWPSNPTAAQRVPLIQHHVIDVPPQLANDPPLVVQDDHQQANPLPPLVDLDMVDPPVVDPAVAVGANPPLVANPLPPLGDLGMVDPPVVEPVVAVGANPPLVANPLPPVVPPAAAV
ncbi:hypothetical protein ZWY2020_004660 [Hordeum vulgare]|nr:hypothetical protein ZWY2020_004660 [Hordeum vulgare]